MNPCRILIVGAEAIAVMEIRDRLAGMGYHIAGLSASGEQALVLAEQHRPDLVLIDISLNDGVEGVTDAGEFRRRFRVPVIFITAHTHDAALHDDKPGGPPVCIHKPFDDCQLKSTIEVALHKHRTEEEILRLSPLYDELNRVNQINEQLRRQVAFLHTLMDAMPYPVFYKDAQLRYLGCNTAFEKLLGVTRDHLTGKTVHDLWPRDDADVYNRADIELLSDAELQNYEATMHDAYSIRHCVQFHKATFRNPDGSVGGIIGAVEDITARKQAEEALRQREEQYRQLFDNMSSGAVVYHLINGGNDFVIVDVNRAAERIERVERRDILGRLLTEVFPGVAEFGLLAVLQRVSRTGVPECLPDRYYSDHRIEGWRDNHICRLPNGDVVAIYDDVTERIEGEKALRESEKQLRHERALLRSLIDSIPDLIFFKDRDSVFLGCNKAFEVYSGMQESLLIGRTDLDIAPRDLAEFYRMMDREMLSSGKALRNEEWIPFKDGGGGQFDTLKTPYFGPKGELLGLIGISRNIDERKQAERRLSTQAAVSLVLAETDSLLDAASKIIRAICEAEGWDFGAIWQVDKQARVLSCVEVWHREGLPAGHVDELAAITGALSCAPGIDLPGQVWATGRPVVIPVLAQDKKYPRAPYAAQAALRNALAFPILNKGEITGVIEFMGREITEPDQKLMEMLSGIGSQIGQFIERRRAQEEASRFVSYSPTVIYALKVGDKGLKLTWASGNLFEITGYRPDEIDEEWWTGRIHPEDRERVFASQQIPYETEHQAIEFRFRRKDESYIWVHDEKRLIRDAEGRPSEIVGSWSDVTERVQLEKQLRQSQKIEGIGKLAGGVAHDFNNLLTVITGYCDMLLTMLPPGDPKRNFVTEIQHAGDRAASLTRQLLAFSRKQILEPKVLDLNEIVSNIEKMLRRLIGEDIVLTTILSPYARRVKVDPSQLEQVVINLAVNARDAMPMGGRLIIETGDSEMGEEFCRLHPGSRPGRYATLWISDTGCGMTSEVMARIFEPFFTTKEPGKGTGLGLSTVFGIVKQSDGYIDVESEAGAGSCFKIYLPVAQVSAETKGPDGDIGQMQRGRETVLLVEDEGIVRQITKTALEMHGYKVLEAGSGPAAIATAETCIDPIHLVLTDVVMPEMSGPKLAEHLRAGKPDLKVLFMSGYTDDDMIRHGMIDEDIEFLQKPFSPLELARKVRKVLDGKK
jgi:two-component system cell cycle sensor histidine kinase/response regulator CckA